MKFNRIQEGKRTVIPKIIFRTHWRVDELGSWFSLECALEGATRSDVSLDSTSTSRPPLACLPHPSELQFYLWNPVSLRLSRIRSLRVLTP